MFDPKLKEALGRVQKPGRYTGGEPGSVYKEKEKMDVRFAFCFPDTYGGEPALSGAMRKTKKAIPPRLCSRGAA